MTTLMRNFGHRLPQTCSARADYFICGNLWSSVAPLIVFLLFFSTAIPAFGLSFDTIQIASVDTHGVVIFWHTDEKSNGSLYYGLGVGEASQVSLELLMSRSHHTSIFNLPEGEEYVFRIQARSEAGVMVTSQWHGFRTWGTPFPKIKEQVNIPALTIEGGTVQWWSNIPVKGIFECGYDTSYGFVQKEDIFSTNHEVMVTRFRPRKRIHYRIRGIDERGYESKEKLGTFTSREHNIAEGASVKGTFTQNPERSYIKDSPPIISRVTDGRLDYFVGMATSANPEDDTQWVEVDLGKLQFVGKILTYWRQLAFPKKFSLFGSVAGDSWIELGDTHDASTGIYVRSRTGDPMWEHEVDVGNRIFRHIRMEVPKGAPTIRRFEGWRFVQLFELKVYPPEVPEKKR